MAFIRKNVWELGGPWADTILWYARGVAAMKTRAIALPTAWDFYGAIHGLDESLWRQLGYLPAGAKLPAKKVQDEFWNQCQHGSWYFLPWHRGYLIALEANIRQEVVKLRGPSDWALPYWNYFKQNENQLPPAFASPDWPDGKGNNPLFVKQRYGPQNNGNVYVDLSQVDLNALNNPKFTGRIKVDRGFGGVDTGFEHTGSYHGGIEYQPHDFVHGLVGGEDSAAGLPGLMSDPDTAALDPIFYLHHCNIDRLWEVWRRASPSHTDPDNVAQWSNGPSAVGQHPFVMPMPDGTSWTYTPKDMTDLGKLNYTYDNFSPAGVASRLTRAAHAATSEGATAVPDGENVELVGASERSLQVQGSDIHAAVKLDSRVQSKVTASLAAPTQAAPPDRVFLNLENIRGQSDANRFGVYINLPAGADPAHYPELLAGRLVLFGLRKASQGNGEGLSHVFEISHIVDALHRRKQFDPGALDVRLVPESPVSERSGITIGRISVYRQGE